MHSESEKNSMYNFMLGKTSVSSSLHFVCVPGVFLSLVQISVLQTALLYGYSFFIIIISP